MRYEERRSSSRGRSSRGYTQAKNRYYEYPTRGHKETDEDHFDSEESYRRERSIRYDRREDGNHRSRSPYGRSTHGRSIRDESDDYTPSSRSRSYRPSDIDRELARHDNGYRRRESPYRGRNNRDSPVSESSDSPESYSDRVQRSGRMAPRMVDSPRKGRGYGHYSDNDYDDGYSRYSGTKSRSASQSSGSYTTDDDEDYDANCMNTLFSGQEEAHGRSSDNILSYKKKGKNASELQLKMTLPLPLQLMDNLEKMVPSKSTIESALETFRVKGGKLAKKCELDYSRLEDQVIIDEEFAGGVMPQFHKALFEDQSEDISDDVGNNVIHLNGRKMNPPGRPDDTKSYSTGPRRPESLPGHVMVDEGITCVSSGPTDAFDEFHPEAGHYQQGHPDYASRFEAGPDILRKINAGLTARNQGRRMPLGDEIERPSFDEGMLPSLSPRENQYASATPKPRDALSKFKRMAEPPKAGKAWIPASKQPLDIVDQAYPSFDAPADEAIKARGAVRQELPVEPESNLLYGVDGIPTAVGYGRNREERDMHTVCSDLTGDDELLYVDEIPVIKNLPVEHEQEEPGEIPRVQTTRVLERKAGSISEHQDYRHVKEHLKNDVASGEQEPTNASHHCDDNDNLSRRVGYSRLRDRRDLDVEILSERSVSRSRLGNRLSYQERSHFSSTSRRGYQLQSADEPSLSSRNRNGSHSHTFINETESQQNYETEQTKSEVSRSGSVSRVCHTTSETSSFDAPMDEEKSDNVNSRGAFSTRSGSSKEPPSRSGRPVTRTTLLTTVSIGTPNDSTERVATSLSRSVTEPDIPGTFELRQKRAAAARMEELHGADGPNMKSPIGNKKPFDEIPEGGDELMMPSTKAKSSLTSDVGQKADPQGCRGASPSSSFGDTKDEGPQLCLVGNVDSNQISKAVETFSEYNKSRNHILDPDGDIPDNDTRLEPEGEIQTVVSDPATWCEETKVTPLEENDGSVTLREDQVDGEPDAENLTVKSADTSEIEEIEEIANMERSVKSEDRSVRSKQSSPTRFTPTQDMDEESQISTPIQTPGGNRVYSEIDAMSQAVEVNYLGGLSVIASVAPTVSECEPPLAIAPTVETQGTHGQTTFSHDTPVQAPPTFDDHDLQHWNFSQPQGKLDTDEFYGGHEDDEEATQYHFDERQAKLSALLPAREHGTSKPKPRSLVLPQEFVAKAFTNMIALVVFFFTEWLRYLTFTHKRRPVQGSNPALPNFRGKDANRDVQTTNSEMIQGAPSFRRRRCGSDGLSIAIEPYVPDVQAATVTPSSARSRSSLRPGVGSATYANIRQSFSRGDARSVASMQGWSAKPSPRVFDFCEE